MPLTVFAHRRLATKAVFLTIVLLLLGLASPAFAVAPTPAPQPTGPGNETPTEKIKRLRGNIAVLAEQVIEAEDQVELSKRKYEQFAKQLAISELDVARLKNGVARYAAEAYKTGRIGVIGVMLNSTSPDAFLSRASALSKMTARDQSRLDTYFAAQELVRVSRDGQAAELKTQQTALAKLAAAKKATERELSRAGGGAPRGYIDPNSPAAKPAPRNSDGSWPKETCSINDPTTSGCITPRTLWAMNEAKRNGFTRYVSCYRPGPSPWEHPKGRACDFASAKGGFAGTATGGDRDYGNRLAYFFVKNAKALGVMYVVWFCEIWHVGSGWERYDSAGSKCGDQPAPDHTNHVHVSIY